MERHQHADTTSCQFGSSDLEARTFLQLFPGPRESTGDIYNASFKSVDTVEGTNVVHRKGMRSFAVASEFHSSCSPVSFYLRSDCSLPPCLSEQYCDHAGPSACLGREAHRPRTVLLAGRLLVASKFPNDGCFSYSRASPTAASFAEGRGLRGFREHGLDGHLQRDCAVKAVRGAWGVFWPLLTADWPSLMRSLPSGTVQKGP